MNKYSAFCRKGELEANFEFYEGNSFPEGIPISTPLTFAFLGKDLVLTEKKTGEWDIPGGKIEEGEGWISALKREIKEEAGVEIDNISVVGYFLAENKSENSPFSKKTVLPVTMSFVNKVDYNWVPRETLARNIFRKSAVKNLFGKRKDARQILEVYDYVLSILNSYEIEFILDKENKFDNVPTAQVMLFCKNKFGEYCIVRDYDEDFFSLPGGGCDLGESDIDCAKRELFEEAQIELRNMHKLATVGILLKKEGKIVNKLKHMRFLCDCGKLNLFEPRKDGFEIEERAFVSFKDLQQKVPLLQNPTGNELMKILK